MIWSVSWKNIWRNKVRSSIVIAAYTVGIFGGIFIVAFMLGMMKQRVSLAIGNEISHIQIHDLLYKENYELKYFIKNSNEIVDSMEKFNEVKALSPRIKIFAMAITPGINSGVMINGINSEKEEKVTKVADCIVTDGGSFFKSIESKPIVIGDKLAKKMKLVRYELNDEDIIRLKENKKLRHIIVSLSSIIGNDYRNESDFDEELANILGKWNVKRFTYDIKKEALKYKLRRKLELRFSSADGNDVHDVFRVTGVYKTANSTFDEMNVYVRSEDIRELSGIPENSVHEIAVLLNDVDESNVMAGKFKSLSVLKDYKVETWEEVMPEMKMYDEMMDFYLLMIMIIILLALSFGIVNTMLMVVLERIKELGMLMAIGMNKMKVFKMIMLETILLSLVGAAAGMGLSIIVLGITSKTGIDMSRLYGEGFESWGFSAHFFPEITIFEFIEVTLLVIIAGFLASIYPARKALKLKPAEALRIDM